MLCPETLNLAKQNEAISELRVSKQDKAGLRGCQLQIGNLPRRFTAKLEETHENMTLEDPGGGVTRQLVK